MRNEKSLLAVQATTHHFIGLSYARFIYFLLSWVNKLHLYLIVGFIIQPRKD